MLVTASQFVSENIQTNTILGESVGFWVQLVVLIVTAGIAYFTLKKNEKMARKRATIDLVLSENQDDNFRGIKEQYALMREDGTNFTLLVCDTSKDTDRLKEIAEQTEIVIAILNQYEFIASAIFENALDEDLYKRMKKGVVIRDWDVLEGFVLELRKQQNRPKIFCETERLVKRWKHPAIR